MMANDFSHACNCIRQREFLRAEHLLLRITANDPQHFDAIHMLGVVYTELQKYEQAETVFLKALSIDAKYPPLFQNYGLFLSKTMQFEKAIAQFDAALKLFPGFAPVYSDKGIALKELKRLDDAIINSASIVGKCHREEEHPAFDLKSTIAGHPS